MCNVSDIEIVRVFPTPELHSGATPLFRLRRNFLDTRRLTSVLTKFLEKPQIGRKRSKTFQKRSTVLSAAKCGVKPRRKESTSKMLHIPAKDALIRSPTLRKHPEMKYCAPPARMRVCKHKPRVSQAPPWAMKSCAFSALF